MSETQKITALVVDDSELMRAVLSAILTQIDVEVIGQASNGRDGVDMAIELEPDMILLDVLMPEMNGYLALEEIVGRMHEPFVIMMTSVDDDEVIQSSIMAGAQDYIQKSQNVEGMTPRLIKHRDALRRRR
tara:strand:- start:32168 stop:32560 length:393 start_codon:yes stop_codon:yes gene_type:complete